MMVSEPQQVSARREELLERAYEYVLAHGMDGVSLRPLATTIGSSPRVLLFLFGSKEGLMRALLQRARADELEVIAGLRQARAGADLAGLGEAVWEWLANERHRGLLRLWTERYARSLLVADGPWEGFAASTVRDWLELLADAQPPVVRSTPRGEADRTLVLAVLRGGLLDLLATGEVERVTEAVRSGLGRLPELG